MRKLVNKKYIIIGLIVVVCSIAAIVFMSQRNNSDYNSFSQEVITITKDGFSPNTITLHVGSSVRWVNESNTDKVSVNSDNYPDNKLYKELNLGQFNRESSVMHTFLAPGTYTYHNQFAPNQTGTIVIK